MLEELSPAGERCEGVGGRLAAEGSVPFCIWSRKGSALGDAAHAGLTYAVHTGQTRRNDRDASAPVKILRFWGPGLEFRTGGAENESLCEIVSTPPHSA